MSYLDRVTAITSADHRDEDRVAVSVGMLRQMERDLRASAATAARARGDAIVTGVCMRIAGGAA